MYEDSNVSLRQVVNKITYYLLYTLGVLKFIVLNPIKFLQIVWYKWRCWSYLPHPKLHSLKRYFTAELEETFGNVGIFFDVVLASTPFEMTYAVVNHSEGKQISETLFKNILKNTWDLEERANYSFKLLGDSGGTFVYSLTFKPRVFVTKVGEIYDRRDASWWEKTRDYLEISCTGIFNIVVPPAMVGLVVFITFFTLLLLLISLSG